MQNEPKVAIIILNWNGRDLLQACLTSLRQTDYKNYNIIVADNGSTDNSVSMVEKQFPEVDIVKLDKNMGFIADNVAAAYAIKKYDPKYIALLDNDIKVYKNNWLYEMVKLAESNPQIGIIGAKLLFPDGTIQHAGGQMNFGISHIGYGEVDSGQYDQIYEVPFVTSACVLIRRSVIEKLGLFDRTLSPLYVNDVEYSVRIHRNGYKVFYCGLAGLIHEMSKTTSKFRSYFYFLRIRNRFIFIMRYFPRKYIKYVVISIGGAFIEDKGVGGRFSSRFKLRKDCFLRLYLIMIAITEAFKKYKHKIAAQLT